MLYNQIHQGGIRALLDWDDTLFDGMVLPEDIDNADTRQLIMDDIILRHGDTPLFIPEPTVMKYYIYSWSARMKPIFQRYLDAVSASYNPIENYDRQEYSTHTTEDTMGNTRTLDTQTDIDGTVTTTGTDTTENSISAENVSTFSPDDKSVRTPNLTDTTDSTSTDTGTITDDGSYDGSLTIDSRIHGNIGVTTSQQMLEQEFNLMPKLDLIRFISDSWANEFCLAVY